VPRASASRWAPLGVTLVGLVAVASGAWRAGSASAAGTGPARGTATRATPIASPHGELKVRCEACHTAQSWTAMRAPLLFEHADTGFPLEGKHAGAQCQDCHTSRVFSRVATSCVDCHRDVHEGQRGPRCQDCHTPQRWTVRADALRKHSSTGFPLRGVHALLECSRCHGGSGEANVARLSSDCVSCHAADYASTRSPSHAAAGYSTRCETCHDASRGRWTGAGFDHASTGFALAGAHRGAACDACHKGGSFTVMPTDCYACHQAAYAATRNPAHSSAGFGTHCATCHNTMAWAGASFDHSKTRFALTGVHRTASCTACHAGGRFTGTPTDCYACHQASYAATSNPAHAAAGFGTQCATCHSTAGWSGASFNHSTTRFALTGVHRTASCTACHVGGRFAGTPSDCYACHQSDYSAAQNPNHQAAGFGTTCGSCHTTTAWRPANFDHDGQFFRIYSGKHRGKWSACAQCHQNTASYRDFSCFGCHVHDQSRIDNSHLNRAGYRYESTACYFCHRGV